MRPADAAGWLGALILVGAYAASSAGRVRVTSRAYQALNLLGSVGLGAVAARHHAWPSLALNVVWLFVAACALARSHSTEPVPPVIPKRKEVRHVNLPAPQPRGPDGA
jgi:formate hydrogenlyase subunit 3/multisubunit Na+/H+ antiporter MnhD subunit